MKALVKARAEPGIWMQDVPEPSVGHNDVLIKVHRSAICGTDIHIWKWDEWAQKTIPVPMHVGHEYVGEIVEIGGVLLGERQWVAQCEFLQSVCREGVKPIFRVIPVTDYDRRHFKRV